MLKIRLKSAFFILPVDVNTVLLKVFFFFCLTLKNFQEHWVVFLVNTLCSFVLFVYFVHEFKCSLTFTVSWIFVKNYK